MLFMDPQTLQVSAEVPVSLSPRVDSHFWAWRWSSAVQQQISYPSCLCQEGETAGIYLVWDRHTVHMDKLPAEGPVPLWVLLEPEEQCSPVCGGCNSSWHHRAAGLVLVEMGFERKLREETAPCYFYPCTSPWRFQLTGLVMKPIL